MHALARLALHPLVPNVQTSWVKMGREGAALCLAAGANDLGGTLMYESITRAAGGTNGQLMDETDLRSIAALAGRPLVERTTLYARVTAGAHADGARTRPARALEEASLARCCGFAFDTPTTSLRVGARPKAPGLRSRAGFLPRTLLGAEALSRRLRRLRAPARRAAGAAPAPAPAQ